MPRQRKRIANSELAFWENNIARALDVIQLGAILAGEIDDPDHLDLLHRMVRSARRMRHEFILEMDRQKLLRGGDDE